jgi:transcriptional activator for dhaKLM operon
LDMQPQNYPVDTENLLELWRSFMDAGQLSASEQMRVDPIILGSWRRCIPRQYPQGIPRPNKAAGPTLASVRNAQSNLISVAQPFLEDVHQFMEGSDCVIMLTDGTACVHTLLGDAAPIQAIEEAGLGQGAYWSEGQLGTNALALTLTDAMPVQVVGPEHFYSACHHLTSTAAPIHDIRGRITGIIAVLGPTSTSNPHTLSLVMAAARAVDNQLLTDWYLDEANLRLTEVNTVLGAISEGLIAWDASGRITHFNDRAGEIMNLNSASVVGRFLESVLDLPIRLARAVQEHRPLHNIEATISVNNIEINCLVNLQPIGEGSTNPAGFIAMIQPIEQVRQLVQQQIGARATLTIDELTSRSAEMAQVIRQARIAAKGMAPVLIHGEGGVGKNHLARAVHNDSPRAEKPFIVIDCRAIPHEIMTREFLGRESQTGILGQPSKFELAHGGTLLLDQVENLSLELQTALLRLLETGQLMRLGGSRTISPDVRIMAATTTVLETKVAAGEFIPHLFYRFGVFNIRIPPLRDRVEDIPLLAQRFLARISPLDGHILQIDDGAMSILMRYPWPGNVREMESVLERGAHLSTNGLIQLVDLPEGVRRGRIISDDSPLAEPVLSVADAEREAILRAGWATNGRVGEMAEQLGIGRTTLWRKMKRLKISPEHFKS